MLGGISKYADPKLSVFSRAMLALSSASSWRAALGIFSASASGAADLVDLLHIDADTGHRDLIAAGYLPAFFNQQWGGAPHYFELVDGVTGTPYKFEAATGYVDQAATITIAAAAGNTAQAQGFKVSKSDSYPAVWLKVCKVGNPTNNLEVRIQADDGSGTKPTANFTAITNGTATAQSGKLHSTDSTGQWVRFVFSTPVALTAGTQYWITAKSSGAVDGSNYWQWMEATGAAGKYPHGSICTADATPTWTVATAFDANFLVEAPATTASLQTGGIFSDGKLTFFEGSPLNQSNARVKDLRDFRGLDLTDCTLLVRGTAWTKDRTILDITYGLDHDRIVLRSNVTTGYAQVDVYDSAGTKRTVTGTTDVSTGSHDICIRIRAKGDGSDSIQLWVDGASQGTPVSSATISFDTLFGQAQIGTAWIGGGFALAPTWSGSSISTFSGLPSTLGWTYTGTATESSAFSVSGGKLYQNYGGFASTDTGYYVKTTAGLSNANGSAVVRRGRTVRANNAYAGAADYTLIEDGTRRFQLYVNEYFTQTYAINHRFYQVDNKSTDYVIAQMIKGTDAFVFENGRLAIDLSANATDTSANNQITMADVSAVAGENADVVHSYWKYYTTAWLPPQFTAGSLSEMAVWNGDKTAILATLYNSGSFVSVKQFCGLGKNYVGDGVVQSLRLRGVTVGATTSSSTGTVEPEMQAFWIGSAVTAEGTCSYYNSSAGNGLYVGISTENDALASSGGSLDGGFTFDSATSWHMWGTNLRRTGMPFGLHLVRRSWSVNAGTGNLSNLRDLKVEARA